MSLRPHVIVAEDPAELARVAAEEIDGRARAAIAARGAFHVALAGGSTPRELYAVLARSPSADFGRWVVWFGDERCVAPDDDRSNFRMARLALLEPAHVPREHWHPISAWERTPDEAARAYEAELRAALGPEPRLDLALLGLGADGHTASLFPASPVLEERTRLVAAVPAQAGRQLARVSLTVSAFRAARGLIFLVAGAEKRAALREVLSGGASGLCLPARILSAAHADCLWLVDRAAASPAQA